MKAMVLDKIVSLAETHQPLRLADTAVPVPAPGELLIRVAACGVCHTELDEIEGRTPPPRLPMILGHQVVGRVESVTEGATGFQIGDRVGVGWIHWACGTCSFCREGLENLCSEFKATGRDMAGGYAQYMAVHHSFAFPIPKRFSDSQAAPLLCAGAIGYRSLGLTGIRDGQSLGLTGFGASGHLVLKMVRHKFPKTPVVVFARSAKERGFAMDLGAQWAGAAEETPPYPLDAIIDTTPVWRPVVEALKHLNPGGRLVINAIRKENADQAALLSLDYPRHLWHEKEIKSVANVTRRDIGEFLRLAADIPILPEFQEYSLEEANQALMELKHKDIRGAKVLRIE